MKVKLILNPKAGEKRNRENKIKRALSLNVQSLEEEIEGYFKQAGIKIVTYITKAPKDATKEAKKSVKEGYDIVIAGGGDGTHNEVINGIINSNIKLGILPLGTVNGMAIELGIPFNLKKACEVIIKGNTRKIDLGTANGGTFMMTAGVGFDAHAVTEVKPLIKKFIGTPAYPIAALKSLFSYKPVELKIDVPGQDIIKGYFVIFNNLTTYGGLFPITPDAKLDDGFLEMCVFKEKDVLSLMKYTIGIASGDLTKVKGLKYLKIKHAIITADEPVLYHREAEIGGTTPVEIKVLKKKLIMLVP
jgi:diacylglycerol kinase (ATP)